MAISSGVKPHTATLVVGGVPFLIDRGSVQQAATRKSGTFECMIPMSAPGALAILAVGGNTASVVVNGATLMVGPLDAANFDMISRLIHVSGRDASAKLHEIKSAEKWLNKTPSDIVQQLASKAGLQAQVQIASNLLAGRKVKDDFAKLSDGISYANIIHKLAEFVGARWYVQGSNLVFTDNPNIGSYSLQYSAIPPHVASDCLNLSISMNYPAASEAKFTVKSWHPEDRKVYESTANAGIVGAIGEALEYTFHLPALTQDHVERYAKSKANEASRHAFTLRAEIAGDPTVAAGMMINLSGTGFFDHTYQADDVYHRFGMEGYTTAITARTAGTSSET